jgi:hypothetical protein
MFINKIGLYVLSVKGRKDGRNSPDAWHMLKRHFFRSDSIGTWFYRFNRIRPFMWFSRFNRIGFSRGFPDSIE